MLARRRCGVACGAVLGGSPNASFAGNWEGTMNDLPGINLSIEEDGGKISGDIVFYYQERSDPNGPWHTRAEYPAPLLSFMWKAKS
jgi:hypothetical protein